MWDGDQGGQKRERAARTRRNETTEMSPHPPFFSIFFLRGMRVSGFCPASSVVPRRFVPATYKYQIHPRAARLSVMGRIQDVHAIFQTLVLISLSLTFVEAFVQPTSVFPSAETHRNSRSCGTSITSGSSSTAVALQAAEATAADDHSQRLTKQAAPPVVSEHKAKHMVWLGRLGMNSPLEVQEQHVSPLTRWLHTE